MAKIFTKLNLADIVATSGGKSFRKLSTEESIPVWNGTDLTDTTWVFGNTLISNYKTSFSYSINWDYVINYDGTTETGTNTAFALTYSGGSCYFPSTGAGACNLVDGHLLYYGYNKAPKVSSSSYPNFESFTVTFTGGQDVTNANLISWLKANATLTSHTMQ